MTTPGATEPEQRALIEYGWPGQLDRIDPRNPWPVGCVYWHRHNEEYCRSLLPKEAGR